MKINEFLAEMGDPYSSLWKDDRFIIASNIDFNEIFEGFINHIKSLDLDSFLKEIILDIGSLMARDSKINKIEDIDYMRVKVDLWAHVLNSCERKFGIYGNPLRSFLANVSYLICAVHDLRIVVLAARSSGRREINERF